MEPELDEPAARQALDEAWEQLEAFSDSLPDEAWPPNFRGSRFLNASVILHVADWMPPDERSKLTRVWNAWIVGQAVLRKAELEAMIVKPSKANRSGLFNLFIVLTALVVGWLLAEWIGVGLGIIMALLFGGFMNVQEHLESYAASEYQQKKQVAYDSKLHILGYKLRPEIAKFERDMWPWQYPQLCTSSRFV